MRYLFLIWSLSIPWQVIATESPTRTNTAVRDCADCPELVDVPAHYFAAGGKRQAFSKVSKFETTWAEYLDSVEGGACLAPALLNGSVADWRDKSLYDRRAVTGVSLADATCYANWLSRKTGKRYRIPTSAEWELVARAGLRTRYPWGESIGRNNAFIAGAYDAQNYPIKNFLGPRSPSNLREVGLLRPNRLGLYDVIGNAAELTSTTRHLPSCGRTNCQMVVVRGAAVLSRSSLSDFVLVGVNQRDAGVGFRLVQE